MRQYYSMHNRFVIDKLSQQVKDKLEEKVKTRAENIHNALRFRRILKGQGGARYPIWKGTVSPTRTDDNSFRSWDKVQRGPLHWVVFNDHKNSVDGYNYVKDIVWGVRKGSNHQWAKAIQSAKNLTFQNGKIFSKQLPQGLVPFYKLQDKLFMEDVETAIAEVNRQRGH